MSEQPKRIQRKRIRKIPAVHFNTNERPLSTDPACHVALHYHKFTRDPFKVTCRLCWRSPEWFNAKYGLGKYSVADAVEVGGIQ